MDWKQSKLQYGFLETATSGGTLTLVANSLQFQILTGSANHTVKLPDATTLAANIAFNILNVSTGVVTVVKADGSTIVSTLTSNSGAFVLVTDITTSNGVWDVKAGSAGSAGGSGSIAPGAAKTANYTIVSGDNGKIIDCDTSAGSFNITLPAPVAGFKVTIKDIGGLASINTINILRNSGEKIDGIASDTQISENNMAVSFITDGTDWYRFDSLHRNTIPTSGRFLVSGGTNATTSIEYFTIATTGNGTSFGSLSTVRNYTSAVSSSLRAIIAGGEPGPLSSSEYVTIATLGNGVNFGNLATARQATGSCSSQTIGIFAGGSTNAGASAIPVTSTIDYFTIPTLANALSFGTLTQGRSGIGGLGSSTRGVFGGGYTGAVSSTIDYVTIATAANAISFGSLSQSRYDLTGCSNPIIGVFAGGTGSVTYSATTDWITIATTGNATSFGGLVHARDTPVAGSSYLRGVFSGGYDGGPENYTDYITFSNLASAVTFGTLATARYNAAGCSSSHGGLSG